jgi:hypothetical protein
MEVQMKWTLRLITELDSGETTVQEAASLEWAEAFVKPGILGLSIDESKRIAAASSHANVADQTDRHNKALIACRFCGQRVKSRRRDTTSRSSNVCSARCPCACGAWGCESRGTQNRTSSSIPTGKNPTSPELKYLTSQLAALIPFGKVADFLDELLPASARTNASTVRNRGCESVAVWKGHL